MPEELTTARRAAVSPPRAARRPQAPQLAPAGPVRRRRRQRLRRQPGGVRGLRAPAGDQLQDRRRRGVRRSRSLNNFWWNRHWTFRSQARGASRRAGGQVLRRLAGRVRLQLRGAGLAGRRRRNRQGRRPGDLDRRRARRCRSSGRSCGASARRRLGGRAGPRSPAPSRPGSAGRRPAARRRWPRHSGGRRHQLHRRHRPARRRARPAAGRRTTATKTVTRPCRAGTPVLVTDSEHAAGRLPADRRQGAADRRRRPRVKAELRRHPRRSRTSTPRARDLAGELVLRPTKPQRELLQVYVDDHTGAVTQAWTGFQVAWTMARGYPARSAAGSTPGTCGCPLCVLFVAPFFPGGAGLAAAPRPADAARLLDLAGVLQPRQDRAVGPARLPVPASTCWCGCCCSPSARASRARPLQHAGPDAVAGGRDGVPDRPSGSGSTSSTPT